jgi:hypothetical protein
MPAFVPFVELAALVYVLFTTLKYAIAGDFKSVLSQVVVWVSGVAVVALFAHSDWASDVVVGTQTLNHLNFFSQIIVGAVVGSAASVGHTAIKALDNTQSAEVPKLLS